MPTILSIFDCIFSCYLIKVVAANIRGVVAINILNYTRNTSDRYCIFHCCSVSPCFFPTFALEKII
jgi:hypothetical protein